MHLSRLILTGAAAALALAGTASAAEKRSCFWTSQVNGFSAPDDRTVYVRVGVKDVYRLDLFAPCADVDWNVEIGLRSRGGPMICSGLDATIISKSSIGPQRCEVRQVTKLTPEEAEALKVRP